MSTEEKALAGWLRELAERFVAQEPETETAEKLGEAFLDFVLERERIRRGVAEPGDARDAIDGETLGRLGSWDSDNPTFAVAEKVFRRLPSDKAGAVNYVERLVTQLAAELSKRQVALIMSRLFMRTGCVNE